jgi:hypothetical protein
MCRRTHCSASRQSCHASSYAIGGRHAVTRAPSRGVGLWVPRPPIDYRSRILANKHRWEPKGDHSAVHGRIAHPGRRATFEQYGRRTHGDRVGRSHADGQIAHTRGGEAADQNGGGTWADDRSAHVGNGRNARRLHGAEVHVGESCGWLGHDGFRKRGIGDLNPNNGQLFSVPVLPGFADSVDVAISVSGLGSESLKQLQPEFLAKGWIDFDLGFGRW